MAQTSTATIDTIMQTASRLFMQRGYRAVSINEIVQAAGVTKPTLYYHFADKEAVFVKMMRQTAEALRARIDAVVTTHTEVTGQLGAIADVLLSEMDGDLRMILREMREHLSTSAQQQMSEVFFANLVRPITAVMQAALDSGELSAHPAHELAALFLGLVSGFVQPHAERGSFGTSFTGVQLAQLFVNGAK
jgi:TetR/AcrR family transcriptional regulator